MKKSQEIEKEPVYLGREVTEETNNIMTLQFQKIKKQSLCSVNNAISIVLSTYLLRVEYVALVVHVNTF